ncbi:hypothetical protein [Novosphingobium sp.]|uniref:hypothetical protein n=1 Tax=Novosphingobium sp. TaxID=1874826 RepID=UPI0035ADA28C
MSQANRALAIVLFALLTSSCAPERSGIPPSVDAASGLRDSVRHKELTPNQVATCKASGGQVMAQGMLQIEACVWRLPDGGKSCQSKSDCIGKCLAEPNSDQIFGDAKSCKCQAESGPVFGCHAELSGGAIGETICAD